MYANKAPSTWSKELQHATKSMKKDCFEFTLNKLAMVGVVYQIWRQGNARIYNSNSMETNDVSQTIVMAAREKVCSSGAAVNNPVNLV